MPFSCITTFTHTSFSYNIILPVLPIHGYKLCNLLLSLLSSVCRRRCAYSQAASDDDSQHEQYINASSAKRQRARRHPISLSVYLFLFLSLSMHMYITLNQPKLNYSCCGNGFVAGRSGGWSHRSLASCG